jgi:hypothetical protein
MLNIDLAIALDATDDFQGLPHRQQELGENGHILFVDDSISTIPESTLAALSVYAGRDITVIVGGYDRGIDYGKLEAFQRRSRRRSSPRRGGKRIYYQTLTASKRRSRSRYIAQSMDDAVSCATRITPPGERCCYRRPHRATDITAITSRGATSPQAGLSGGEPAAIRIGMAAILDRRNALDIYRVNLVGKSERHRRGDIAMNWLRYRSRSNQPRATFSAWAMWMVF